MTATKHIVLQAANAWGHLKPLIGTTSHILDARPNVILTLLTSNQYYAKIVEEIARVSKHGDRFHVIDIQGTPPIVFEETHAEFGPAFEALWNSGSISCKSSGKTISGLPRPTMAIIDLFSYNAGTAIRTITGSQCQLAIYLVGSANSTIRDMGPEELGGVGDFRAKIDARVAAGEDRVEASNKVWFRTDGEVIKMAGLPPVFDYERFPQQFNLPHMLIAQDVHRFLLLADIAVVPTSDVLEKEILDAFRGWYGSLGKTVWACGPSAHPEEHTAISVVSAPKPEDEKVLSFLDRVHKTHGDKSIFYISFGTIFWPSDPARLWAIIDELLASKTPFLFAQASPMAVVPPEYSAVIEASEISLAAPWVPQDAVLAHPAIGWFITHAGWNSTQESLLAKVPPIFYPMAGDQPGNALLLSEGHKAAFELLSVRTGLGQRIPYRCRDGPAPEFTVEGVRKETRELLRRLKGDEGQRVRAKFESLGDAYRNTWKEGGEAQVNLDAILTKFMD